MAKSLEQKIAQKENEIARLKAQARKKENGQKIIIGGLMLAVTKDDPEMARLLLQLIQSKVTRKTDLDRLDNVIEDLKKNSEDTSYDTSYEDTSYEDLN